MSPGKALEKPLNLTILQKDSAESSALDADLQKVAAAWPGLSPALRAAILAVARSVGK